MYIHPSNKFKICQYDTRQKEIAVKSINFHAYANILTRDLLGSSPQSIYPNSEQNKGTIPGLRLELRFPVFILTLRGKWGITC